MAWSNRCSYGKRYSLPFADRGKPGPVCPHTSTHRAPCFSTAGDRLTYGKQTCCRLQTNAGAHPESEARITPHEAEANVFQTEMKLFFRVPQEGEKANKRKLLPGTVEAIEGSKLTIVLEKAHDAIAADLEAFIHFELRRKFMQQAVTVESVDEEEPTRLVVELQGDPVSAEARQFYRSSCLASEINAVVGEETCKVVDVSATGFAVYAAQEYKVGAKLPVKVMWDGTDYLGEATIQGSRRVNKDHTRYGLHVIDTKTREHNLKGNLGAINNGVQAEQARRMRGIG